MSRNKTCLLLCMFLVLSVILSGCGRAEDASEDKKAAETEVFGKEGGEEGKADMGRTKEYSRETKVADVIHDSVFEDYGRLIFPVNQTISKNLGLQDVEEILPWYSSVNPDRTVEIVNYLRNQAEEGVQIFYDIYTEEEKAKDPDKENTGLFFFRGEPGAVIMQYTGLSEGDRDGTAHICLRGNQRRDCIIQDNGIPHPKDSGAGHGRSD